ncbi:hypothetical protein SAMN05877753_10493 [Bacillus oleivorans]|uniref:Uncharacterized protein n=1 Tax=Bacillus oleivorans TaxID=1448271 RepID=A0A285CS49_9BACI|nr:SE1561 family protein [Bacillus oleivorans]SNX70387.1 hypothetical protein SAMN05877753_10493 [Bacillus oleivorans]
MANSIQKDEPIQLLKQRLHLFLETLENIDPEETELEDIDRLLAMIEDMEVKLQQVK